MALENLCRLCVNSCNESKELYDEQGKGNELYEITAKFLHPTIVNMDISKHLTSICVKCWQHLCDFQSFQMTVLMAQKFLLSNANQTQSADEAITEPSAVKTETPNTSYAPQYDMSIVPENQIIINTETNGFQNQTPDAANDDEATLSAEEMDVSAPQFEITFLDSEGETDMQTAFIDENEVPQLDEDVSNPSDNFNLLDCEQFAAKANFHKEFTRKYATTDLNDLMSKLMPNLNCPLCLDYCTNYNELRHHFQIKHPSDEFYMLCFCSSEKLKRYTQIKDHFLVHFDHEFFKCGICGHNGCKAKHSLHSHLMRQHSELLKNICGECGSSLPSKAGLIKHYITKHKAARPPVDAITDQSSKDDNLGVTFEITDVEYDDVNANLPDNTEMSSKNDSEDVNNFAYNFEQKYESCKLPDLIAQWIPNLKCTKCSESIPNLPSMDQHFHEKHPNEEMRILCFCNQSKSITALKDHLLCHGDPFFFKCKLCTNSLFKRKIYLMHHINRHHSKYVCPICAISFSTEWELQSHCEEAHEEAHEEPHENDDNSPTEVLEILSDVETQQVCNESDTAKRTTSGRRKALYKCDLCDRVLKTRRNLREHNTRHTLRDIYLCAFCPQTFRRMQCVVRHRREEHPDATDRTYFYNIDEPN